MLPCGCGINSKSQSQFLCPLCFWQCYSTIFGYFRPFFWSTPTKPWCIKKLSRQFIICQCPLLVCKLWNAFSRLCPRKRNIENFPVIQICGALRYLVKAHAPSWRERKFVCVSNLATSSFPRLHHIPLNCFVLPLMWESATVTCVWISCVCHRHFPLSHGWVSSPREGIFLLDQLDGDWSRLWFLVSQVRLGHCDYFIVQYVQRHVSNSSVLYQALIWLDLQIGLPARLFPYQN